MSFLSRLYGRTLGGKVFSRRVQILCAQMAPLFPTGAKVLDVGCGNGLIAHHLLQKRPDLHIQGIDVLRQPDPMIPVELFDGEHLPFPDKSFDAVMFVDVLHHTNEPMSLLREAVRVARQTLVIKDHPRNGFLAGTTLRFMDWVANARYAMALPYNYWPRQRWFDAFEELGLAVPFWETRLGLYRPLSWLFGRGLHFIAQLDVPQDSPSQRTFWHQIAQPSK